MSQFSVVPGDIRQTVNNYSIRLLPHFHSPMVFYMRHIQSGCRRFFSRCKRRVDVSPYWIPEPILSGSSSPSSKWMDSDVSLAQIKVYFTLWSFLNSINLSTFRTDTKRWVMLWKWHFFIHSVIHFFSTGTRSKILSTLYEAYGHYCLH